MEVSANLEGLKLVDTTGAAELSHAANNPIDLFLDSLVDNVEEDGDLHQAVLHQLERVDRPGWLVDLCALNMSDDEPNAEQISKFLHQYRKEKPWVISEARMAVMRKLAKDMAADTTSSHQGQEGESVRNPIQGTPLPDDTLEEFLDRMKNFCKPLSGQHIVFDGSSVDDYNASRGSYIGVQDVDSLLGIAGFRPDNSLLHPNSSKSSEHVFNEWRKHVRIGSSPKGYEIEVSLEPVFGSSSQAWDNERYQGCITQILLLYRRLQITIDKLQKTGQVGQELIYLRRSISRTNGRRQLAHSAAGTSEDLDNYSFLETRAVSLDQVGGLLKKVEEFSDKFSQKASSTFWPWAGTVFSALFGSINLPAFLFGFVINFIRGWSSATVPMRLEALSELTIATSPIIDMISVAGITHEQHAQELSDQEKLQEKLHEIALTGQMLCLALQGNARALETPFEFEGLVDRPISQFRLRGIDLDKPSICAFSQRLSSLNDREFLVIDGADTDYGTVSEFRTTPAAVMRLWRPVQLLVQAKDLENHSRASCIALVTGDDLVLLHNKLQGLDPPDRWQWLSFHDINFDLLLQEHNRELIPGGGIHEEIRIDLNWDADAVNFDQAPTPQPSIVNSSRVPTTQTSEEYRAQQEIQQQPSQINRQRSKSRQRGAEAPKAISSNNREGDRGSDHSPAPILNEHGPTSCRWESKDAENMRREEKKDSLLTLREESGSWQVDCLQAQIGIQPPYLSIQSLMQFTRTKAKPYRKTMLERAEIFNELERSTCVILSLHTGVLRRVRLREVVAYFTAKCFSLTGLDASQKQILVTFLQSSSSLSDWTESMEHQDGGPELIMALNAITAATFGKLSSWTGMFHRKGLSLLWPGWPINRLKISPQRERWMEALKDTKETTTFACIVPYCQETPECRCRMATAKDQPDPDWKFPTTFRLQTSVCGYQEYADDSSSSLELRRGKSYWINDPKLGILAEVIGIAGTEAELNNAQTTFYLSLRSSNLPGWISKYFSSYPIIRETSQSSRTINCIIGSQAEFKASVKQYLSAS